MKKTYKAIFDFTVLLIQCKLWTIIIFYTVLTHAKETFSDILV